MTKVVLHSTLVAVSITLAFLPAPSEAIAPALFLFSFSGMGCKECMVLVPATVPALGMGMGMLKPMIPQLRQARAEMRALSPAEQRSALLENLDSGFFPPRVVACARAAVGR